MNTATRPTLRIALVAGEESGDQLGAEIMDALHDCFDGHRDLEFAGLGGQRMIARGLTSSFDQEEVAVMGISAVLKRLPRIIRLAYQLIDDLVAFNPDVMMIIDSPDLTHPVARRVHKKLPRLPIANYVSPSVWAWRPGRARRMVRYIDHVLAILPFEPEAYQRLKGPPCTYVGHPLVRKIAQAKKQIEQEDFGKSLPTRHPNLLVMPGSRNSEINLLLPRFRDAIADLAVLFPEMSVTIPAVSHLAERIKSETGDWPITPSIVQGEAAKFEAFNQADLALVASGTVTLELSLWGVPMVVAYRLDFIARRLKWLGQVDSIVLPNLILGHNIVPEFIDEACTGAALSRACQDLLAAKGQPQLAAFDRMRSELMTLDADPAQTAVKTLLDADLLTGSGSSFP